MGIFRDFLSAVPTDPATAKGVLQPGQGLLNPQMGEKRFPKAWNFPVAPARRALSLKISVHSALEGAFLREAGEHRSPNIPMEQDYPQTFPWVRLSSPPAAQIPGRAQSKALHGDRSARTAQGCQDSPGQSPAPG